MNELDKKIIAELEKNSRKTNLSIAKKLGASESTIRKRITKMSDAGVLRFTVSLTTKIGFSAIVMVNTNTQAKTSTIVDAIKKINDVKEIFEVAGDADVVLRVSCHSPEDFNAIIEKLRSIPNVLETRTYTILKIS